MLLHKPDGYGNDTNDHKAYRDSAIVAYSFRNEPGIRLRDPDGNELWCDTTVAVEQ